MTACFDFSLLTQFFLGMLKVLVRVVSFRSSSSRASCTACSLVANGESGPLASASGASVLFSLRSVHLAHSTPSIYSRSVYSSRSSRMS